MKLAHYINFVLFITALLTAPLLDGVLCLFLGPYQVVFALVVTSLVISKRVFKLVLWYWFFVILSLIISVGYLNFSTIEYYYLPLATGGYFVFVTYCASIDSKTIKTKHEL